MTETPDTVRQATIDTLERGAWDVLVVGGGATGVATLLEATERGLRAALIERDDIAAETSSRSSKLVHGGLRYLEQFQFRLVRQALGERSHFLRDVPHLVHMERFLVPVHGSLLAMPYMAAGLATYDLLGAAHDGGRTAMLRPGSVLRCAPQTRRQRLRGGFIYHDAVMDDARLAMSLLRTAINAGASAATRLEATSLEWASGLVSVAACDRETGRSLTITARAVVDATGPAGGITRSAPNRIIASRGVHIVLERDAIDTEIGMTLRANGRVVFVIPWLDRWLVGTTDVPHVGDISRPHATEEEIAYLLNCLGLALEAPVDRSRVISTYAGIRPLVAPRRSADSVQVSREHKVELAAPGVVEVRGGKYTTARIMARDAVDLATGQRANRKRPKLEIVGRLPTAERLSFVTALGKEFGVDPTIVDRLAGRHGRQTEQVLRLGQTMDLLRPLDEDTGVLEAEVPWAARIELARSVDDVLARRTRLALLLRDHGASVAPRVAQLLAPELGWTADTAARSAAAYRSSAPREYGLPGLEA